MNLLAGRAYIDRLAAYAVIGVKNTGVLPIGIYFDPCQRIASVDSIRLCCHNLRSNRRYEP